MSIKRADGGGVSSAVQARAEAARQAAQAAARQAAAQATRAAAQQSSFEPQAARNTLKLDGNTAPASSLLTENTRDGNVNCLDRAADFISKSTPQLSSSLKSEVERASSTSRTAERTGCPAPSTPATETSAA